MYKKTNVHHLMLQKLKTRLQYLWVRKLIIFNMLAYAYFRYVFMCLMWSVKRTETCSIIDIYNTELLFSTATRLVTLKCHHIMGWIPLKIDSYLLNFSVNSFFCHEDVGSLYGGRQSPEYTLSHRRGQKPSYLKSHCVLCGY